MPREFVSKDRLRELLNAALHEVLGCDDVDLQNVVQLDQPGPFGENWTTDITSFDGRHADVECRRAAFRIADKHAQQYSVNWGAD